MAEMAPLASVFAPSGRAAEWAGRYGMCRDGRSGRSRPKGTISCNLQFWYSPAQSVFDICIQGVEDLRLDIANYSSQSG